MPLLLLSSCGKDTTSAPLPLPEDQISPAIAKAFAGADRQTQDEANQYVSDVIKRDYAAAFADVTELSRKPGLTKDQRGILARALMTTSQDVQQAAASGDNHATQVINSYSATK